MRKYADKSTPKNAKLSSSQRLQKSSSQKSLNRHVDSDTESSRNKKIAPQPTLRQASPLRNSQRIKSSPYKQVIFAVRHLFSANPLRTKKTREITETRRLTISSRILRGGEGTLMDDWWSPSEKL